MAEIHVCWLCNCISIEQKPPKKMHSFPTCTGLDHGCKISQFHPSGPSTSSFENSRPATSPRGCIYVIYVICLNMNATVHDMNANLVGNSGQFRNAPNFFGEYEYPELLSSLLTTRQSGWWFQPLRKILVNQDDEIPNIWKNKNHVPNHQPGWTSSNVFPTFYITCVKPIECPETPRW